MTAGTAAQSASMATPSYESDRELEVIAVEISRDQDLPCVLVTHVMPTSLTR